jgi:calcineurin-like phosphoesterase family protein
MAASVPKQPRQMPVAGAPPQRYPSATRRAGRRPAFRDIEVELALYTNAGAVNNASTVMKIPRGALALVLLAPLVMACSDKQPTPIGPTPGPGPGPSPAPTPSLTAVLIGAGDIADCDNENGRFAEATARLLDKITDATVFTAGDNAYFNGSDAEYANCYGPRWGRHLRRTNPSPGNHEYQITPRPYFDYFGERAGPRGAGFYSYTLGNWHVVSLNSNVAVTPGSEQMLWLRNDLEASKGTKCSLAYWHHPLFTSGPSAGSNGLMREVWRVLFEFGVDIVVNGHDHLYERFDMQDFNGRRDTQAGVREFIAGSGGAPLYDFGPTAPNSLFKLKAYGILQLTLRDVGYDSVFIEALTERQYDPSFGNLCH